MLDDIKQIKLSKINFLNKNEKFTEERLCSNDKNVLLVNFIITYV